MSSVFRGMTNQEAMAWIKGLADDEIVRTAGLLTMGDQVRLVTLAGLTLDEGEEPAGKAARMSFGDWVKLLQSIKAAG